MSLDIQTITNTIHATAPYAAALAGILGLSAFQQKLKHKLELENPKVIQLITVLFAAAGAVVPAFLGWFGTQDLGYKGTVIFTGLTLGYRYVIEPGNVALDKWRKERAELAAYKARSAAQADGVAVVPDMGVPAELVATPVVANDNF